MRVLVAEEDANLRAAMSATLRGAGFAVDTAADLEDADLTLALNAYDSVVLDRSLPGGDALAYVAARRREGWAVPVLFLTGRESTVDRVAGLSWGDEILAKPFAVAELVVRVRSLARRGSVSAPPVLRAGDLVIDPERGEARRGGEPLALTVKEFAVLRALVARAGRAVPRSELLAHAWDVPTTPATNVLDVLIAQLRRKLGGRTSIQTVRGVGYRLTIDPAEQWPVESPSVPRLPASERHVETVPRRGLGAGRAFLEGLAGVVSFGLPLRESPSAGLMDTAVANVADAARRAGRGDASD